MLAQTQEFLDAFQGEIDKLRVKIDAFPWENKTAYAYWLAQTYYLVRHTTRFLALGAARASIENRAEHYAFIHHLKEESNHDLVALKDLKTLGFEPSQFEEFAETRLIQHNQYYWLEYGPPVSLNGYALCLEGLSTQAGPELVERVGRGGMATATSFLKLHVQVDEDHFADGLKMLEGMTTDQRDAVFKNLVESCVLYGNVLEACAAAAHARTDTSTKGQPRLKLAG